jgi:hypothetical protein
MKIDTLNTLLQENSVDIATLHPIHLATDEDIFFLQLQPSQAFMLWQILRERVSQTECWPVILGTDEHVAVHLQTFADSQDTADQILAMAQQIDLDVWFPIRLREIGYAPRNVDPDPDRKTIEDLREPWPLDVSDELRKWYSWPLSYRLNPSALTVTMALLPTETSWHAPAWLKFGDRNNCPSPDLQVRLLKYWADQYGAEIVGVGKDTLELRVERPPTEPQIALDLAHEQFIYCPDLIDREVKTIDMLAALLLNNPSWLFWWD